MPIKLKKSLQIYLSKLKKPTPQLRISHRAITSSTCWILPGCKHPKTPSFAAGRHRPDSHNSDETAALADVDVDHFYHKDTHDLGNSTSFLLESSGLVDPPPDARPSQRFFVLPSSSNSLIEEARSSRNTTTFDDIGSSSNTLPDYIPESIALSAQMKGLNLPDDSIAILTYSSNPYDDFQRSMKEMVDAYFWRYRTIDWDFMEELLFCYLMLNEKKSHKYILGAFVDLIATLRQNTCRIPAKAPKYSGHW
ncbi:PREDICTED: transcription repressor OFP14-like [Nelumbo nucifera]|nr:PREDICTED: transcription repressor OFP14-like [Nelumbo nucifera]